MYQYYVFEIQKYAKKAEDAQAEEVKDDKKKK